MSIPIHIIENFSCSLSVPVAANVDVVLYMDDDYGEECGSGTVWLMPESLTVTCENAGAMGLYIFLEITVYGYQSSFPVCDVTATGCKHNHPVISLAQSHV